MCVYKVKRVGSWNVKIQRIAENKHLYLTGIKIYMYKLLSKALFVLGGITFNFTYEPSRFFFNRWVLHRSDYKICMHATSI